MSPQSFEFTDIRALQQPRLRDAANSARHDETKTRERGAFKKLNALGLIWLRTMMNLYSIIMKLDSIMMKLDGIMMKLDGHTH